MADYLIDCLGVFYEGNDLHPTYTARTKQRIYIINFTDYLGPALGGDAPQLLLDKAQRESLEAHMDFLGVEGARPEGFESPTFGFEVREAPIARAR